MSFKKVVGTMTVLAGAYGGLTFFYTPIADTNKSLGELYIDPFEYDNEVDLMEKMYGMKKLRERLIGAAEGRVLEVCSGTGRNIQMLAKNKQITSLVCSDKSEKMLEVAGSKIDSSPFRIEFILADSQRLPFEDGEFDTVVDTFGICSVEDPHQFMQEIQRVTKPKGKVLLLEHGRGHSWIDGFLDRRSAVRAQKWGCLWNRDIEDIVAESDLRVVASSTKHLGTTKVFYCKKD